MRRTYSNEFAGVALGLPPNEGRCRECGGRIRTSSPGLRSGGRMCSLGADRRRRPGETGCRPGVGGRAVPRPGSPAVRRRGDDTGVRPDSRCGEFRFRVVPGAAEAAGPLRVLQHRDRIARAFRGGWAAARGGTGGHELGGLRGDVRAARCRGGCCGVDGTFRPGASRAGGLAAGAVCRALRGTGRGRRRLSRAAGGGVGRDAPVSRRIPLPGLRGSVLQARPDHGI